MANSSMDREPLTWLREQLEQAHPDLLREMMAAIAQQLMAAEAQEACGAEYGERSAERVNSRNGFRLRDWDTRVGSIQLAVPKLRQGSYFPDWLLTPRRRGRAGDGGRHRPGLPGGSLDPKSGGAGADARHPIDLQVAGLRGLQESGSHGGRLPQPAAGCRPLQLCLGRRADPALPRWWPHRQRGDRDCHRRQRRWPPGDLGRRRIHPRTAPPGPASCVAWSLAA